MKRKRINPPRRKRLNRSRRLQVASKWIAEYNGKNLIKGYSKWFGVTRLCAAIELQMIGLEIPPSTTDRLRRLEQELGEARRAKREKHEVQAWPDAWIEECLYYSELKTFVTGNRMRTANARPSRHAPASVLRQRSEGDELPF